MASDRRQRLALVCFGMARIPEMTTVALANKCIRTYRCQLKTVHMHCFVIIRR